MSPSADQITGKYTSGQIESFYVNNLSPIKQHSRLPKEEYFESGLISLLYEEEIDPLDSILDLLCISKLFITSMESEKDQTSLHYVLNSRDKLHNLTIKKEKTNEDGLFVVQRISKPRIHLG